MQVHRQRQVIGEQSIEYVQVVGFERSGKQDMIQRAAGLPGRITQQRAYRMQGQRRAETRMSVQLIGRAVQIAHDHDMPERSDDLAEIIELADPAAMAECQVGDEHVQGIGPIAIARMDGTASGQCAR